MCKSLCVFNNLKIEYRWFACNKKKHVLNFSHFCWKYSTFLPPWQTTTLLHIIILIHRPIQLPPFPCYIHYPWLPMAHLEKEDQTSRNVRTSLVEFFNCNKLLPCSLNSEKKIPWCVLSRKTVIQLNLPCTLLAVESKLTRS